MIFYLQHHRLEVLHINNMYWFKIRDINKLLGTKVNRSFYTKRGYEVREELIDTSGGYQKALYVDFYAVLCRLNFAGYQNQDLIHEFLSKFYIKPRIKNTMTMKGIF